MVKVETVKGAISPDALGITLPHEHLLVDFSGLLEEPEEASEKWMVDAPVTIENLEKLMRNRMISKDNLQQIDVNLAINELKEFKLYDGKSIVEATPIGCGRDPLGLKRISNETGMNILCVTGWYISTLHPEYIRRKSIDDLSSIMVNELTDGIGTTKIKAGLIKCGCSYPIQPDEVKVLQAAARAQRDSGAPFTIHPGGVGVDEKSIEPILNIIRKEEANLEKTYICHMDNFLIGNKGWNLPLDYHKSIMDEYEGITIEFDTFGKNYWFKFPSLIRYDNMRVAAVTELCSQGYDKNILISQDNGFKMHLKKYGGYGYSQILKYVVPELEFQGVNEKQINNMLIENPKRILAY